MDMKLYILRHGETDLNVQGRLQGWLDAPLNENGVRAAAETGRALREIRFDRAISSPLRRALETARLILAENAGQPPVETDGRLREISFGDWEGLGCMPGNYEVPKEIIMDFFYDPMRYRGTPGGETIEDVCVRTADFLRELTSDPGNDGKTILISTHGCAMRALLRPVYESREGAAYTFWQERRPPNCAVNILRVSDGGMTLEAEDRVYYDESLVIP